MNHLSEEHLFQFTGEASEPRIERKWAMPSRHTFEIAPISDLLDEVLSGRSLVIDPCAGRSNRGTLRNDLANGVDGSEWLDGLIAGRVRGDAVLLDPPYSPRQISECYKSVGRVVTGQDTQNARLYKRLKDRLDQVLIPGGVAVCCGWNTTGFGATRGYRLDRVLLVCHGAAHNDTIVTVETKL